MADVVTVGGSISGLATALMLSRRGHRVTVVERDADSTPSGPEAAWAGWQRRGVPHLRGTHIFAARGVGVLRQRLPDVLTSLEQSGARQVPVLPPMPGAEPVTRLDCRRTTYELVLRRAALAQPGVRFVFGTEVVGLAATSRRGTGPTRVTGVRTAAGDMLRADLVVDASGRKSRLTGWLSDIGVRAPPSESSSRDMSVHTRWYRRRRPEGDPSGVVADLGYAAIVLAPADDDVFSCTFGVLGRAPGLQPLRWEGPFQQAAMSLPMAVPWVHPDVATPISGVRFMGRLPNRLNCVARAVPPVATGIVCLGDAAACTNPRFGRGVSLALVHAACLAQALDDTEDPLAAAMAHARATREELEPWYHDAVADDEVRRYIAERVRAGEPSRSIGGRADPDAVRFARATPFAVQRDPVVKAAFHRTWNLLDPPSSFAGNRDIRDRVERIWRTVEHDPPPPPGPSYGQFVRLLAAAETAAGPRHRLV